MRQGWRRGRTFAMRLLAVPLGLAGVVLMGWGLIQSLLTLSLQSRLAMILLALAAVYIVVDALLAFWDKLPAPERRRARTSWRWRSRWLLRSRPLSFWPVFLVLLTSVLGIADWLPAAGWSRPMMLGVIATVGIYGYFREQADQKKSLLAFADVARSRFAEEAKRIHRERDRDIEAKEFRSLNQQQAKGRQDEQAEIDRLFDNVESP
jgi:hypothetical protein